ALRAPVSGAPRGHHPREKELMHSAEGVHSRVAERGTGEAGTARIRPGRLKQVARRTVEVLCPEPVAVLRYSIRVGSEGARAGAVIAVRRNHEAHRKRIRGGRFPSRLEAVAYIRRRATC